MAKYMEWTPEQERDWAEWLEGRPEAVRVVAERIRPDTLYRLKGTGQRVFPVGYGEEEDGRVTVRVGVSGLYNFVTFERSVFGINPDDLTECELPSPDELTGSLDMEIEDVRAVLGERP